MTTPKDPNQHFEKVPDESDIEKGLKEKELQNLVLKKILEAIEQGPSDDIQHPGKKVDKRT